MTTGNKHPAYLTPSITQEYTRGGVGNRSEKDEATFLLYVTGKLD